MDALEFLRERKRMCNSYTGCEGCPLVATECVIRDMTSEDTCKRIAADVVPVVHGKWIFGKDLPYSWGEIPKNKYHLYCSECLEQAFNRSEDNDPDFDVDTSYCPNCGCRMDGGDGNER